MEVWLSNGPRIGLKHCTASSNRCERETDSWVVSHPTGDMKLPLQYPFKSDFVSNLRSIILPCLALVTIDILKCVHHQSSPEKNTRVCFVCDLAKPDVDVRILSISMLGTVMVGRTGADMYYYTAVS